MGLKARVKATGEIVEISEDCSYVYAEHFDKSYNINELEFLDVKEKSFPKDEDYWTRLEHQYAGMAMQVMITDPALINVYSEDGKIAMKSFVEATADICYDFAHALVEKYKKEER